ncbi:MAG: acyl carrier protein [Clostridium sp.]|nr:acyl carrier protein [Clostridium sp.]
MILEKVKNVVAKEIGVEVEELDVNASLADDLGVDSLEIFEIVIGLEEEFNIEIPNDDIAEIKTTVEIAKYIENKIG